MEMKCRIGFLSLLLASGSALADNYIEVYGGAMGTDYKVFPVLRSVQFMTPGTYIVRASNGPGQLGDINQIWVESAEGDPVSGTVIVGVYDWDTGPTAAGAEDVWEVNLSGATDGRLSTFRIAGTYGDAEYGGKMQVLGGETICIGGDVVVPPAVDKAVEIPQLLSGSVMIGGNILSAASLPAHQSGAVPMRTGQALARIGTSPVLGVDPAANSTATGHRLEE
jgi:hypothetical protein